MVVPIAVTITAETWNDGRLGLLDANSSSGGGSVCRGGFCG